MTLGHHELSKDEVTFIKGALVVRALNEIVIALKAIAARVEYAASKTSKSESSTPDGEEYEDLQRLVNSLTRRYHSLMKKLITTNNEVEQWRSIGVTELN